MFYTIKIYVVNHDAKTSCMLFDTMSLSKGSQRWLIKPCVICPYFYLQDGYSPFLQACKSGHLKVVELLADRGADINATTNVICARHMCTNAVGRWTVIMCAMYFDVPHVWACCALAVHREAYQ
jgi:hypothetical protein